MGTGPVGVREAHGVDTLTRFKDGVWYMGMDKGSRGRWHRPHQVGPGATGRHDQTIFH